MKQYTVTGMTCAACSARVEKAVSKVAGVESCSVSLLTNSMGIEGTADDAQIIEAVINAGYVASVKDETSSDSSERTGENDLTDRETPVLKKRLIFSLILLLPLLYVSMGHMMWNWPLPPAMQDNHIAMGLYQLILSALIMVINQKFFISGFKALFHLSPNMDTLVSLGSLASFVYSTAALFLMTSAQLKGDSQAVVKYMHEFYFEAAAMILTLITTGKMLEARSKGKTTDALKSLMKLSPETAVLLVDSKEITVPVKNVKKGDIFIVRPGQSIPVDGIILEGESSVNESALTGESIPADKKAGDSVSAATINTSGFLKCRAERVGQDTTLSQIIAMVSDAAATKAPVAKIADKVSGIFVPAVIGIALITFAAWFLTGSDAGTALTRAVAVLVISCPCALGLATPVAVMVANGSAARNGILFKTSAALEIAGRTDIVVLDKTGTITNGTPEVTDILPSPQSTEEELLSCAFSLEKMSEHPLAKAVVRACTEKNINAKEVSGFKALPGNGLSANLSDKTLSGGNLEFIKTKTSVPEEIRQKAQSLSQSGKTPLFFALDDRFLGIIAAADTIKKDSPEAVKELKQMGIRVIMLTGDNEQTARAVAAQAGVEEVIAGVLPDGKEEVIRKLQEESSAPQAGRSKSRKNSKNKVAMVGDGINDAPALTRADTGIAIGAGTDVAIDSADVVLMKSSLADVPAAIRLSRAALRNIYQNLFWAFFYNAAGIPLAAGAFIKAFGWQLNPMFAAAAMSLSSFCVVSNALRLNLFNIYGKKTVRKNTQTHKESKMEKTVSINGMMCSHCEMHVKKALEALDFIESAKADHEAKKAVLTLKEGAEFSESAVKDAVTEAGYEFKGIE
jgi:Cu2+-exporting ATPase